MLKLDFQSQIFKVDPTVDPLFNPETPIVFRCINMLWLSTSENIYNSLISIKHIASFVKSPS